MNAKKSKRARALIQEIVTSKRGMTKEEEKLISKYSRAYKVAPEKVLNFLRGQHLKTQDCEGCSCANKAL